MVGFMVIDMTSNDKPPDDIAAASDKAVAPVILIFS